jgi:hypothetical protein
MTTRTRRLLCATADLFPVTVFAAALTIWITL